MVSTSLRPHTSLSCPSPSSRMLKLISIESMMSSNHLTLCDRPFSSCPQFSPTSESFLMSQLFTSGGLSIRASALVTVLPMNSQDGFPLGLTGLISLLSKGLYRVFSSTTIRKYQFFGAWPSLWSNCHICTWLLENLYLWLDRLLSAKWCSCFLIFCLGLSQLFFQGASIF